MKLKTLTKSISKHLGSGLAVGAMIGVAVTCYFVAKEAPEAKEALEELDEDAGVAEKAAVVAKSCKKSIVAGVATEAMILGSNFAHKRTIGALTAFAATQVTKKNEIEATARKIFGDDADKIQKTVVEEHLHQPEVLENAIYTGHGNVLCYEPICGHYFYASRQFIENTRLRLERGLLTFDEDYITLNEWLDELGLPQSLIGESIGWERKANRDTIEINFDAGVTEGLPYLIIKYNELPEEIGGWK